MYREKNKEYLASKKKETYTCECGTILCKDKKTRHEQTKRHLNYFQTGSKDYHCDCGKVLKTEFLYNKHKKICL
jgi:hypothetical protein